MTAADVEDKVRNFIGQNFLYSKSTDALRGTDSFLGKGIVDSTGVLELIAFLETEFSVKVEDEELMPENLDTVDRLVVFVRRKLGA